MPKEKRGEGHSAIQRSIGMRIKWVREGLRLNQAEVGELIGLQDMSGISHFEAGRRLPSVFNVIELSNRLRVSTDFLLKGQLFGRTDPELAALLSALHPELVLPPEYTDPSMGTGLASDRSRSSKKPTT